MAALPPTAPPTNTVPPTIITPNTTNTTNVSTTDPPPRTTHPESISCAELLQLFQSGKKPGRDFVLVDLRRVDHEGGTIRGSINLPAQSLYAAIPTLYTLFEGAGMRMVVWYCGSSRGRGTRAAGWFDDYIQDQGNTGMKSVILLDGIKGWSRAGEEYVQLMDEYQEEVWQK